MYIDLLKFKMKSKIKSLSFQEYIQINLELQEKDIKDFYIKAKVVDIKPAEIQTAILIPKESYDKCFGHYIKSAIAIGYSKSGFGIDGEPLVTPLIVIEVSVRETLVKTSFMYIILAVPRVE